MAIADSRALLADIMDIVDEHVTAKASKELEKRILDVLDGYEIATMIQDASGDADNSQQQILGHEKVETTRRYCHANQRNTENSYRKYACM